ncbi:MAG: EamA family transporter [Firmicutes bacterium]|nr:EamA family transporter [Bacillota bacterium]
MNVKERRQYILGLLLAVAAGTAYGLDPSFASMALDGGCGRLSFVCLRAASSLPALAVLMLLQPAEKRSAPTGRELLHILYIALSLIGTYYLVLTAYARIGTGLATALHFTYPMFTVLCGAALYREPVTRLNMFCVLLALAGVACCNSPGGAGPDLWGMVIAVISGVGYALYITLLGHSGVDQLNPFVLAFWMDLSIASLSGLLLLLSGSFTLRLGLSVWGCIIASALIVACVGRPLFQLSVQRIGAERGAILSTTEPLVALLMGVLVRHETCTPRMLLGVGLILIAVIAVPAADLRRVNRS